MILMNYINNFLFHYSQKKKLCKKNTFTTEKKKNTELHLCIKFCDVYHETSDNTRNNNIYACKTFMTPKSYRMLKYIYV